MASQRLSVRISLGLSQRLRRHSRKRGKPESEIVREALENFLNAAMKEPSAYDVAMELGLIGCAKGLPKDLSTNPKYMEGFGKSK
jgi:predicted DNA-binding protein